MGGTNRDKDTIGQTTQEKRNIQNDLNWNKYPITWSKRRKRKKRSKTETKI